MDEEDEDEDDWLVENREDCPRRASNDLLELGLLCIWAIVPLCILTIVPLCVWSHIVTPGDWAIVTLGVLSSCDSESLSYCDSGSLRYCDYGSLSYCDSGSLGYSDSGEVAGLGKVTKCTKNHCEVRKPSVKQKSHQNISKAERNKGFRCSILERQMCLKNKNTKQSQQLMELRFGECGRLVRVEPLLGYWTGTCEIAPYVGKDLDDKLDEKEAVVSKSKLVDWVIGYRERRQTLLFCVDFMLNLTNEEMQRQLSRSVTEWEECFAKLESSWGYWFSDAKQLLKGPIDATDALKQNQMANETSADAAMRYPRTRKLRHRHVDKTKQNCIKKTASEKESLTRSRSTNDQEPRSVIEMEDSISDEENSVNDLTSLLEEEGNVSDKTILTENRTTVNSRSLMEMNWFL